MKRYQWLMTAAISACLWIATGQQAAGMSPEAAETSCIETAEKTEETETRIFEQAGEAGTCNDEKAVMEHTLTVQVVEIMDEDCVQDEASDMTADDIEKDHSVGETETPIEENEWIPETVFTEAGLQTEALEETMRPEGEAAGKRPNPDEGQNEDGFTENPYENKAVYDFVVRMYENVLNRQPEEAGLSYWYGQIIHGQKTGADVVSGFFGSQEYKKKNISDDIYLEQLYQTLLNRSSDTSGKTYWMAVFEYGVSRDYLMRGFINSMEYGKRCADSGIAIGEIVLTQARDQNLNITRYITHFYRTLLGRRGDEGGLNNWTEGLLTKKYNGAVILKNFFFSDEYLKKNRSDDVYIDDLYSAALSRTADASGRAYWLATLEDGVSRHYSAAGFNNSVEYKKLLVRYGISEGRYLWLEPRDQKREVTAYMNQMIYEGTGIRDDAETLNRDLGDLYQGKTSAADLVVKYMSADHFNHLDQRAFINKVYQLTLGRNATAAEIDDGSALIAYEGRSEMVRQLTACPDFSNFCKAHDILMVGTKDNVAMQYAKRQMDVLGWDVRAAFQWIVNNFSYMTMNAYTGSEHTQYYGRYGFENGRGNCYVMAAVYYWMAKAKGINIDYYEGLVPGSRVPLTPHGWCEANINGSRYIFDPDFQYETGKNGYMFVYKTPGTWKYTGGVIMNDR